MSLNISNSASHQVRPQSRGLKGEDTCNRGRWSNNNNKSFSVKSIVGFCFILTQAPLHTACYKEWFLNYSIQIGH